MEGSTFSLPLPMEGKPVPFHLPGHFERFYRADLRLVAGSRLRSREINERYTRWAMEHGEPAVSLTQQRDYLEAIGHRRVQSNGIHYVDIGYADEFPSVPDNLTLPLFRRSGAIGDDRASKALLAKVDAALASLLELRRAVVAARESVAPHIAAQIALGFDR